jgi:hypothetical protein
MSDSKYLSDSTWKDLTSKHKIKDTGLLKSLVELKKIDDEAYEESVNVLDEVVKQAGTLKKAKDVAANPAVFKHLAELISAAEEAKRKAAKSAAAAEKDRQGKAEADKKAKAEAEKKAKAEAEASKKKEKEDEKNARKGAAENPEEEEASELLTTKLIPLLRTVKGKGERMHALVSTTGKEVVVLLSRKPIPPARRKLLKDELGGAGGIKHITGHCIREHGKVTFVLEKVISGMRKLIEAALLEQTGQRTKVKVRSQDGEFDEEDTEEDEDEGDEAEQDDEGDGDAGDSDQDDEDEDEDEEDGQEEEEEVDEEEEDEEPRTATSQPPAASPPPAAGQAAPRATAQAPAQAAAAAQARSAPPAAAEEAAGPPPTPQQMVVLEDRRRQFKQARAAWVAVKARAEQDLEKVKDGAHMAYMADPAQFPKVVAGCKAIDDILDNLDDELRDTLDQYASTPLRNQVKLQALATTAKATLDRYQQFVASNALMKAIDEKEFADVTVHAPITRALAVLRKALG